MRLDYRDRLTRRNHFQCLLLTNRSKFSVIVVILDITRVKVNTSGVSTGNFSTTSIYFDSTQYTFDNEYLSSAVSGMSTIGGGTTSSIPFGNFSWGRIELDYRTKSISYPAYTLGGIGIGGTNPTGIHTSPIVARTEKLKSKNYTI